MIGVVTSVRYVNGRGHDTSEVTDGPPTGRRTPRDTKSAAEYDTQFLKYSVDTDFNEESKVFLFHEGLKPKIQDALSIRDCEPDILVKLAESCFQLDQCLYKHRKEGRSLREVQTECTVITTHELRQNLWSCSSTAAVMIQAYSTPPAPDPLRCPGRLYTSSVTHSLCVRVLSLKKRGRRDWIPGHALFAVTRVT